MSLDKDWQNLVLKGATESSLSTLESPIPQSGGTYPLLGLEVRSAESDLSSKSWSLHLLLREKFSEDETTALGEFVDVIEQVSEPPKSDGETLESFLTACRVGKECRVAVDLNLLRNISEIQRLRSQYPDVETWILSSPGQKGDDPEQLVGETIRQLTGVLAGCQILEILQGESESFHSLWARLNVARIMALESDLQKLVDTTSGAGLFSELQARFED